MKLFFGCAQEDRNFVDILMAFLNRMFEIELRDMFNCFVGTNRLRVGETFHNDIKQYIKECDRAIIVLTPKSLNSIYCLCELGAAWGLDKNIILILIDPSRIESLSGTPFTGTEAWYVNLRDSDSISSFITCITTDSKFTERQRQMGRTERASAESQFEEDLLNLGLRYAPIPPPPDYRKSYAFHENSDPNTLRILMNHKEKIKVKIDFTNSNPKFVGFFLDLNYSDWAGLIANDYSLALKVNALSTVKAVKLEFKNKSPDERLTMIGHHVINLTTDVQEISINLREINDNPNDWQYMKELAFVFESDYVDEVGTFTVSDINFVSSSLS